MAADGRILPAVLGSGFRTLEDVSALGSVVVIGILVKDLLFTSALLHAQLWLAAVKTAAALWNKKVVDRSVPCLVLRSMGGSHSNCKKVMNDGL